jgi:hypothetical protein
MIAASFGGSLPPVGWIICSKTFYLLNLTLHGRKQTDPMITPSFPRSPLAQDALGAAGLLAFGAAYNLAVQSLRRRHGDHGYTAILVAGGVVATLAAVAPRVGLRASAYVLGAFVCSGLPMMLGDAGRHLDLEGRAVDALDRVLAAALDTVTDAADLSPR